MSRDFIKCVAESVKAGIINEDQAEDMRQAWMSIKAQGHSDDKAKEIMAKDIEGMIRNRERVSLKNAGALRNLQEDASGWTNAAGQKDPVQGYLMKYFRRGDEGQFEPHSDPKRGMSAKDLEDVINREFIQETNAAAQEFRKGWLTGDLKRTSALLAKISPSASRVQARALDVLRAMKGEGTKDPVAKQLGQILTDAVEKLRVRFNEAGGMVGKLEGWTPQAYNADAMINYVQKHGLEKLVDTWIERIDWDRTRSMFSGRKFSPLEQREILREAFRKISTNGWVDREDLAAPQGKGALWKQHADHRFLHYKSADDWLAFAKEFGNQDPIASIFGWAQVMARDISHMEIFGPNPVANRTYMKNWLTQQAALVKSNDAVIASTREELKGLARQMTRANPNYETLIDRRADILMELDALRASRGGSIWRAKQAVSPNTPNSPQVQAYLEQKAKLDRDLMDVQKQLMAHEDKGTTTVTDLQIEAEFKRLLDTMPEEIPFYDRGNPDGYTARMLQWADAYWEDMRGNLSSPLDSRVAESFAVARNLTTMSLLGGAVLSSVSDAATQTKTRTMMGMALAKSQPFRVLMQTLKEALPMNRQEAARSYLVAEAAISSQYATAMNASRLTKARAITGFMADRVMSMQGLNAYTTGGKVAFGMEFFGHMADHVHMKWAELPELFRNVLVKGAFGPEQWDALRSIPVHQDPNGARFLRPNEVLRFNEGLGEKYLAMMQLWQRYAVIESTPEGRALLLGGTKRGTASGEIARGFGQLKSFPLTVTLMHMGHLKNEIAGGNTARGAKHTAAFLITGMMLGVVAMAMKDVAAGRDPRRWLDEDTYLDPNIWFAALLQSGGLGIYGDFLFSQTNRHGAGLSSTIAGPMWQKVESLINLTIGNTMDVGNNVIRAARGEATKPTRFGREMTKFLRTNFPAVFWNRLILDRVLFDEAQKLLDPEASIAFDREIKRRRKEFRQEYFWAPGTTAPQRPPDLLRQFATR